MPFLIFYGKLSVSQHFIVEPLLDKSIKELLNQFQPKFTQKTSIMIGLQVLERLQTLHERGYLHLDLKLENLMIPISRDKSLIYLIDFGISKPFLDHKGVHIKKRSNVPFTGNILFASKNLFVNREQSRRDDLISLVYLVLYFLNGGMSWLGKLRNGSQQQYFAKVGHWKNTKTTQQLC